MSALGLAMEAMVTLLTPKFIAFFLILCELDSKNFAFAELTSLRSGIIVNVSVAFDPIEVEAAFYRYGCGERHSISKIEADFYSKLCEPFLQHIAGREMYHLWHEEHTCVLQRTASGESADLLRLLQSAKTSVSS